VSETKEPKIARKGVLIALGIICIILVACLGGVVAAYTLMINDKSNTISSLNYQISQLNSSVANLQKQVASDNSTIDSLTSQVRNLQDQLDLNVTVATYTVVGTLSYANVSAVYVGIIVDSINPSFSPNLHGSFMFLTFKGQLASTLPINGAWVFGNMVAINGTISFDEHSQAYFLNWINGSLCSDTVEGDNEQLGLQLTMALQKTKYSLGESISVTLTITNISNQTIRFGLGPYNDFDFRVYNGTNSILYQWSDRWIGVAVYAHVLLETLNAGESLSENLAWQQTCYNSGLSEGVPVSSGTYYIVGRIGGPIYYPANSTIETTPIQIAIA
jgi:hypothetical protein